MFFAGDEAGRLIGMTFSRLLVFIACSLAVLALSSCAVTTGTHKPLEATDFSQYTDSPIPAEASLWLLAGKQTRPGPTITDAANQISGRSRRERLYRAVDYIWSNFHYERGLNSAMLSRTAEELFKEKTLGGCADYALAQVALFRTVGIPAQVVLTANIEWMQGYKKNDLIMTSGHVFIEVYLENRWYLVDPTYRFLYPHYDRTSKSYPRGEYFVMRGKDYWELGLIDVPNLVDLFHDRALSFRREWYQDPTYAIDGLLAL
jgi:transglutaminase-like putative cysteine protease